MPDFFFFFGKNARKSIVPGCLNSFSFIDQGWLKCEDTACGTRVQKLPLMFQRGHPVCSTCQKGILHPEVMFCFYASTMKWCGW